MSVRSGFVSRVLAAALCAFLFSLAAPADAKKAAKKKGKASSAVVPAAAPTAVVPAAAVEVAVDAAEPTDEVLARARALYDALEYERVIPLANAVLERGTISPDQKLDAYLLQASSLAIIGDPIEAEKPFRMLLRGRPDFDMPTQTPPKIMAVFRKVQVEERAIQEQMRAIEIARTIKSLRLVGAHPAEATGGFPLGFAYRLQDPTTAVDSMRILYRRQGESSYSALALKRDPEGVWSGVISGEWTASDDGFGVEFYLATAGPLGDLLQDGSASSPHVVKVAPGSVERATPPPLPLWSFVAASSVAAVLGLASAGSGVAFNIVQSDYRTMSSSSSLIDGRDLRDLGETGDTLALSTNVLLVSTGVVVVVAGVMALFTNWSGLTYEDAPVVQE
ncbi:MAG: tetratricopeptide repeat protein [Pseudomonadota bacterium]